MAEAEFWTTLENGDVATAELQIQQAPGFLSILHPETRLAPLLHVAALNVPTDEQLGPIVALLLQDNENVDPAAMAPVLMDQLYQHGVNSTVHRFQALALGLNFASGLHYAAYVEAKSHQGDQWLRDMMQTLVENHKEDLNERDHQDMLPLDFLHDQGPHGARNEFINHRVVYVHAAMGFSDTATEEDG